MTNTRQKILAAAVELYQSGGDKAVTMRAIGDRIGLSAMAIYRHFKNREELLACMTQSAGQVFMQYLTRALSESGPLEQLRGAGLAYVAFALEQPRLYEQLFLASASAAAPGGDWHQTETFQFLVARVQDCIEADILPGPDATETAIQLWAHVHGLVSLHAAGMLHASDSEFVAFYTHNANALLEMIRKA